MLDEALYERGGIVRIFSPYDGLDCTVRVVPPLADTPEMFIAATEAQRKAVNEILKQHRQLLNAPLPRRREDDR